MFDILNENGHFDPIHEAHSIEQVLFVVQIERSLSDDELSDIRQNAQQFITSGELPASSENQGFIFMGIGISNPTPIQNGFVLSRILPNGTVEKELRIERNSITFRSLNYLRWDDFLVKVKTYFEPIVSVLFSTENKITGISLNVIDKFVWSGESEKCNAISLLSSECDYLCPHIFKVNDLWHSHTGAFIKVDNKTKRLLNVNIDSFDENQPKGSRRVVVIATVLTDLLNQVGYQPFDLNNTNAMVEIEAKLQELHTFSKEVFGNIINEKMSKRIALIE